MNIQSATITNFRKFKDSVSFQFTNEMLFVGKNNSGKTSVSELFSRFLSSKAMFAFEDFNYSVFDPEEINALYNDFFEVKEDKVKLNEFCKNCLGKFPAIKLDVTIIVDSNDDFAILKPLFFEFENNEEIIISSRYEVTDSRKIFIEFEEYKKNIDEVNIQIEEQNAILGISFFEFIKRHLSVYYSSNYYSTKKGSNFLNSIDFNTTIANIFHVGLINARRDLDDTSDQKAQNISLSLWEYFNRFKNGKIHNDDHFKKAKDSIRDNLDRNYSEIFNELLRSIETDVLLAEEGMNIAVSSDFEIENILKKNSKFRYLLGFVEFSESYNGLGLSNLIYIFIRVKLFMIDTQRKKAPINILFIEEPESHLHPQVQSTF